MNVTATGPVLEEWVEALDAFGAGWGSSALLLGDDAPRLAKVYEEAGAPGVSGHGSEWALLGDLETPSEMEPAHWDLPAGSLDLAVLRHAVSDQATLVGALREAFRVLRPGGTVLVADVSVEAMMDGSVFRYPCRLQYALFPDLRKWERRRHVGRADLDIEVVRAGFRRVSATDLDQTIGRFPDHRSYLDHVRDGGWRSWDGLSADQREWALAELERGLSDLLPELPLVDREAWHLAAGTKH